MKLLVAALSAIVGAAVAAGAPVKTHVRTEMPGSAARGDPSADRVMSLPGLNETLPYEMYAGYVTPAGTDKNIHYWLVKAEDVDPATAPTVLWLTGGPGCSAALAMLQEHGPVHVLPNGKGLYRNPWAWNKVANVVYFDAPVGVGFSWSPNTAEYEHQNDWGVAKDNMGALQAFFEKFPELRANDFYITGESYAGIYVPTLVDTIMEANAAGNNPTLNLKGFAVGNGLMSQEVNDNSIIYFAYYHGLIDTDMWTDLKSHCCTPSGSDVDCNFHDPQAGSVCETLTTEATTIIYSSGLNMYNLYYRCESQVDDFDPAKSRFPADMSMLFKPLQARGKIDVAKLTREARMHASRSGNVGETVPCINTKPENDWLNSEAVREALHVPSNVQQWSVCSATVGNSYNNTVPDVTFIYKKYFDTTSPPLHGLVYNGDVDMACNFLGNEEVLGRLDLAETIPRRMWHYDGDQVAGFAQRFHDSLDFVTVRGAGHMVPQMGFGNPKGALEMLTSFLNHTLPE